jgi:16S rRNA (guanine966-N2)-methyltransferase
MRIISGQRRGHKFDGPNDDQTRPTSDLVREAIFNIIGEVVEDRLVIDLYAGAGGLGLEALSRGASRAIFIELKGENVTIIRRNLVTLRFENVGTVIKSDAHRWARAFEPENDDPVIMFLDPPYREYENYPERVRQTLERLIAKLPEDSMLVVESRSSLDDEVLPEFDRWDVRRYGGTQVSFRIINRTGVVAESVDEVDQEVDDLHDEEDLEGNE